MNTNLNRTRHTRTWIGAIVTGLATLLSLLVLASLISYMTLPAGPDEIPVDAGGLSILIPLLLFAYCGFTLLAVIVGAETLISGPSYAKLLFSSLMLILTTSALLAAWRIVDATPPLGGWKAWWSPLLQVACLAAIPAGVPALGLFAGISRLLAPNES